MGTIARMDVRLGLDSADFESGIAKAQASAENFSKKLGSLGTTMSLAITAPMVGIAAVAVKSAGDFEQSLNIMGQVTGATGSQMAALQQQALDLGATTSFSAGEAAAAMLELGKAGLSPVEIGAAIAGTMDMAAAGNMELATAATIAANAMNAFSLPAAEVTNVANMLAAAANASSADIDDLAAGMQMAGAVFASNGQSVSDLATGMAILANNGIAGSDAGTSLKTMLMRLTAPTGDAADAIKALGIQVYNADGSMRDFGSIVGSLESATAGLTDQQRNMALTTIFGADAIRAATILAGEGADGFADMAQALGKQGAAAATANARMKGIAGAIEYLKGSIDSFLITAALPFLDSLSGIVRAAADLLTMVGELPAPVRNTALAFAAVLAATGPVLLIVSKLVPVFGMIGAALGALASPIGLVVLGVAALGAAWATNFGGVRDMTMQALAAMEPGFKELQSWLDLAAKGDYSGLMSEIGGAIDSVKVAVSTFQWADFITAMTDWGTYIAGLAWNTVITALTDWGAYVAAIDWGAYIATLTSWGAYITALDWGGYITAALDWGAYVTTLAWTEYIKPLAWDGWLVKIDWAAVGVTALDWATWIPAIAWTMFISPVRWASWLAALAWNTVINPLAWNSFIPKMAAWSEYLSKLDWNIILNPVAWGLYISTLDWGAFLPVKFAWSKFLEKIDWLDHIPVFSWPTFDTPDWAKFVAVLAWPTIPEVKWADFIPDVEWPSIPEVKWADFIPDIEWPDIPSFPGWVDILAALGFGKSIPTNPPAGGGQNPATQSGSGVSGGATGDLPIDVTPAYPETNINDLTGGSAANIPTDIGSPWDIFGAGAPALVLNNYGPVSNEVDLQALAWQVAQLINRRR